MRRAMAPAARSSSAATRAPSGTLDGVPASPSASQAMPESSTRPSAASSSSRKWCRCTPSRSSASASSPSRWAASAGPSPSRCASAAPMTSPRSPRVHVTSSTSPDRAHVARRAPVERVSSSGCAWTASSRLTASGALGPRRHPRALGLVEHDLADAHDLGRHLDALVLARELERLLEREPARGDEVLEGVRGRSPHIRELLLLRDVDVHVLAARVLADDLALVHLGGGLDEERAALLEVDHREGSDLALAVRDERAGAARLDRAGPRLVAVRDRRRDARAAGLGEELGAEADEAARWHDELHADPARAVVGHGLHAALALREQLGDGAEILLGNVDRHVLHGLVNLAVHLPRDDLRLADRELETLAAHLLDEDRERELAAALHLPGVRSLRGEHAQRDVADELGVEPVLDLTRRDLVALAAFARERRSVDADGHRDRGVVHRDEWERPRVVKVGERLADRDLRNAGDGHDVPGPGVRRRNAIESLRLEQLGDLDRLDRTVRTGPRDLLALADRAVEDAQQREATEERRGVEVGHVRLERGTLGVRGRGDLLEDRREERLEVGAVGEGAVRGLVEARAARLGCGEHDGDVEDRVEVEVGDLVVQVAREPEQQVGGLRDDLLDPRVGAVNLV